MFERAEFDVFEDKKVPGDWRVEATDYTEDCICYVALFSGSYAEELAKEYYAWKSQQASS